MPNEPSRWWFLPWMSLAIAPADRDEARPGRDRHEPAAGHDDVEQVVEADAGRDGHGAGGVVDPHRVVGWREPQHVATAVLGRIAVRAAETAGDATPVGQVLDRRRQSGLVDLDQFRGARRRPSPSGEQRPPRACSNRCSRCRNPTKPQYGHSGTSRPSRREHRAEAELEGHLERHVLHEPRQLRQLAAGIATGDRRGGRRGRSSATASARRTGTADRRRARAGSPASRRPTRTSRGSASSHPARRVDPSRGCRPAPARSDGRRRRRARRSARRSRRARRRRTSAGA